LLHEIVNVRLINDPACILQNIDTALQEILKQKEGRNSDGMDIAICYFEKIEQKNTKIIFAGSKSKLFCVDNKQLIEIVGDRHFLGGRKEGTKNFTNKELILSSDAQFYFFSDGFSDQNNQKRQKIGSKYFKELVFRASQHDFYQQAHILENHLLEHQQQEIQRDDITVIGLKIS